MLTVVESRALKPRDRPFKVSDGDGLYLLVQPSGALLALSLQGFRDWEILMFEGFQAGLAWIIILRKR